MTATLTTVNGILKEVYEGTINDQLSDERVTAKRIERTSEGVVSTVGGKYVTFPLRTGRNHGISYRPENGQLAPAGRQKYVAATETLKYGYGRVAITGQTMALAEKNFQSFASALDRELDGLKMDISRDENRIIYGHVSGAATGIMAQLTATATNAQQTVDSTAMLEPGMVVDVVNAGTPVAGGTAVTIVSIDSATLVTFSGSVTGTSGNHIVRTGNWDNEPYGLNQLVDSTGVVHNVDPAAEATWSSVEDGSTTTLTELSMIQNCDAVYRKGGSKISAIFCSLGVRRSYFNLMTALRRYNEPKEFSGGLVGLAFNYGTEIPVVADKDCPDKHMFGLDESEITIWRDKEWYWEDTDGSVFKWVHDYDRFEALMKCYWQLGTHKRNAHFKMTNITES